MTMASPGVVCLHSWGMSAPRDLAQGLKATLDTHNT